MRRIILFIKDMSIVYFIISLIILFLTIIINRRYGIDINYIKMSRALLIISFFISVAFVIFKLDKIPTFFRIALGYAVLFYTTFVIRNLLGTRLFRTSFGLLIFILICTILYFISLLILVTVNKKEEKEMNDALSDRALDE